MVMSEDKKEPFYPLEKGMFMEGPKVIDGFLVDFMRVKVDETDGAPAQSIACLKHLHTGADCYVSTDSQTKKSDQELVEMSKGVLSRLVAEGELFAQLNSTSGLGEVHKVIGSYPSAQDSQGLGKVRQNFKEVAGKFPGIAENLNQIDLAATWDWQIQQNLRKPAEMIFDFKPIEGLDLDIKPGPILLDPKSFNKNSGVL
jgi:hypothetical protein